MEQILPMSPQAVDLSATFCGLIILTQAHAQWLGYLVFIGGRGTPIFHWSNCHPTQYRTVDNLHGLLQDGGSGKTVLVSMPGSHLLQFQKYSGRSEVGHGRSPWHGGEAVAMEGERWHIHWSMCLDQGTKRPSVRSDMACRSTEQQGSGREHEQHHLTRMISATGTHSWRQDFYGCNKPLHF